ncbi:vacuolar membrane protein-domain-containing protein [Schizophyllum fasciatum]
MSTDLEEYPDGYDEASPGDYPDVDRHSCQLLGPTALVVQALMGVLVITSLLYKRYREKPRRPWRIWLFDVSKQVVGQMFVHGVNVLISGVVSHHTSNNACVSYFLNILIDTTLGVGLIYLILQLFDELLTNKLQFKGFKSGIYGTPPSLGYWARQSAVYVLALTTMKLLVVGLLVLFPGIFNIGEWLLSWTWSDDGDGLQVVITMGLFPIIMNILQFWLIDSIVKASEVALPSHDEHLDEHDPLDREPLFEARSDDEDDDVGRPRHDIENPRSTSHSRSPMRRSRSIHKDDAFTSIRSASLGDIKGTPPSDSEGHDEHHSYPPSLSSSLASASSAASTAGSLTPKPASSKLNKPRRKEAPAALALVHPPSRKATQDDDEAQAGHDSWGNWGEGDDWAERVGEEEWTGRRISNKKDELGSVWMNPSPALLSARKMD